MEKVKEFIKDYKNDLSDIPAAQNEKDFQEKMESLKPEINNLLHTYLPGNLTIDEMDTLAMAINDMVWNPRKYLPQCAAKPPQEL